MKQAKENSQNSDKAIDGEILNSEDGLSSTDDKSVSATVNVNVRAEQVNVNKSALDALLAISKENPDLAQKIAETSSYIAKSEYRKYLVAAILTGLIVLLVVGASFVIILLQGMFSGLTFFLVCISIFGLAAIIFTGQVPDLSWTIRFVPKSFSKDADGKQDDT